MNEERINEIYQSVNLLEIGEKPLEEPSKLLKELIEEIDDLILQKEDLNKENSLLLTKIADIKTEKEDLVDELDMLEGELQLYLEKYGEI